MIPSEVMITRPSECAQGCERLRTESWQRRQKIAIAA